MVEDSTTQRITRLLPLATVLTTINRGVRPAGVQRRPLHAAGNLILAEDIVAPLLPPAAIALRDGYAVASCVIADAGPYAPVRLAKIPARVDVGEVLPNGADAVAPLDAVVLQGNHASAIAAIAPGDGVLAAGGDAASNTPLRRSGERLRPTDVAVMAAAGVADVMVRAPSIHVARGRPDDRAMPVEAILGWLARAITDAGGTVLEGAEDALPLDAALPEGDADAVIAVGGTGGGRGDEAVRALMRLGQVEAHGVALSPGETAAFGFVGTRPVLLIPGRLDAAFAVWLLIGRYLVARLTGAAVEDRPVMMPLRRKATSAIGLTELIPVSCSEGMAEPLASSYLSFTALARSDGWIAIPAGSEGFAAGTPVAVNPWS
jgi:molybdopterin molybdotransferase